MSLPKRDGVHDRYYLIHKPDTSPELLAEADLCIQDVLNGTARENHSAYPTVVRNHNGIYREIIKDNIEYDHLIQNCKIDKDRLDEIVDLMLETVCTARKTIRIAGDDYPAELVKSKFMKLNSSHIEFILDCMRENTTKVRNIKQYLKAVLFNAPSTIDSYYTALVNHDLYGGE